MMNNRLAMAMICTHLAVGNAALSGILPTSGLQQLPGRKISITNRYDDTTFVLNFEDETFYLEVPPEYNGSRPYGLIVFMHSTNRFTIPDDWKNILAQRRFLYIAPQQVGNRQPAARRLALAVAAARKMQELANIDTGRIFITGLSGGGRIASMSAFYQPELFRGCFPICGAEFIHPVERKHATRDDDYGYTPLPEKISEDIKARMRFVLITGEDDFRRGNILDLYHDGFVKHGFATKLLDVPGMGHDVCNADILEKALDFLESSEL